MKLSSTFQLIALVVAIIGIAIAFLLPGYGSLAFLFVLVAIGLVVAGVILGSRRP